jgi:acyl phosphate:glycerol-3-phosphate acyltransferase
MPIAASSMRFLDSVGQAQGNFCKTFVTLLHVKGFLKYHEDHHAIVNKTGGYLNRDIKVAIMIEDDLLRIIIVIIFSYLIGSIPTAYLVAKTKGINIFEVGSGNMGATNVMRALGFGWGIFVWFCDSVKGIIAILLGTLIMPDRLGAATAIAATVAVIGHNWSLFALLFTGTLRGGKGAAIWFGTMLVMAPFQVIAGMCLLGGLIIAATRYVSLAVLGMFALSTLWVIILISQREMRIEYIFYFLTVTAMILYRFRENIQRLLAGTERRIGENA